MKKSIFIALLLTGCATQPTPQTIAEDLKKVQADLATLVPAATEAAKIAEVASGNGALVPLTDAVSAAVQAANAAAASAPPVK
jgi:hypothetical protein